MAGASGPSPEAPSLDAPSPEAPSLDAPSFEALSFEALSFEALSFEALGPHRLYELLALRQRVFVVEQRCAYLDADGKDQEAVHVLGRAGGVLVACARVLGPGVSFDEPAIGRVIVAPEWRGRGVSRLVMRTAIDAARATHGDRPLALSAQAHLVDLYAGLGFVARGEIYDEDGIPHRDMVLGVD
jgi:ElaA protein